METASKTQVIKDLKEKSILVSREFEAPLPTVWRAYTDSKILDQWWGPEPWRAETKSMNFAVGGYWLYAMVGPANERHWARMDYTAIDHHKSFSMRDGFADENGNMNTSLPISAGQNVFTKTEIILKFGIMIFVGYRLDAYGVVVEKIQICI